MITSLHSYRLHFWGKGGALFSVFLLNMIFTVLTLGIYYPWAKVAVMKYMYEETEFAGSRFMYHGTGKELFIGFIKALLIFGFVYLLFLLHLATDDPILTAIGFLMFYASLITLIPMAIHGAVKYRMSRTSWRGIHFGYRGSRDELMQKFFLGALLTLFSFGIYGAWLTVKLRNYTISHMRFGNIRFHHAARGRDFFFLHLKSYFLTLVTFGIYGFWYARNLFNFWVDHTSLIQDGRQIKLRSTAKGGDFFMLLVPNVLLIVFTLGLGTPWAMIRSMNFVFDHIVLEGELHVNSIHQTEAAYKDATGVELVEMLELDLM